MVRTGPRCVPEASPPGLCLLPSDAPQPHKWEALQLCRTVKLRRSKSKYRPYKAQQQADNEMSPNVTTEAGQPFPARSTVAQRKQANEMRKVRDATLYWPGNVSCFDAKVPPNNAHTLSSRLSNPCWRREDVLALMTVSLTWRAWSCLSLAKTTHVTPSWRKPTFLKWPSGSSETFLPLPSKVSVVC